MVGGSKGGLFLDVSNLSRIWSHPYILTMRGAPNLEDPMDVKREVAPSNAHKPQVWPLTQLFLFPFCKRTLLIRLEGNEIPPYQIHFCLPLLPATPSFRSRTLEGLVELTRCLSRALDSPFVLLQEVQRYKDTIRCDRHAASKQLIQTLIVRWLKRAFLHRSFFVKSQQSKIELVTRPDGIREETTLTSKSLRSMMMMTRVDLSSMTVMERQSSKAKRVKNCRKTTMAAGTA